jgi:hypothetical protein
MGMGLRRQRKRDTLVVAVTGVGGNHPPGELVTALSSSGVVGSQREPC